MKKIGQVRKVIDVTTKNLDEILVGAFEGGSNYWLSKVRVKDKDYKGGKYASDVIGLGGELILTTTEGEKHTLTQEKMIKGIQIYLDSTNLQNFPFEETNPDGFTYDNMVQYALFGELVYG